MKDNVFWGIVGGVLVLVILGFYFMVWDKWGTYQDRSTDLKSRVTQMEKFAGKVNDLPTQKLREANEEFTSDWTANRDATLVYLEQRDADFESFRFVGQDLGSPDLATWTTAYRDAFDKLAGDYREHTDTGSEEPVPFDKIKDIGDANKVLDYQKEWRVTSTLVRAVMDVKGSNVRRCRATRVEDPDLEHFKRLRFQLEADLPASKVSSVMKTVLSDSGINFDVRRLLVSKSLHSLPAEAETVITVSEGSVAPGEPNVVLILDVDVLDWEKPAPKAAPAEDDEKSASKGKRPKRPKKGKRGKKDRG